MRGTVQVKGCAVSYESSLERDLLIVLDFLPTARDVRGQPITLRFRDVDGRVRRYTPDVAVRFEPSIEPEYPGGMIYEVKYRADLLAQWPQLKPGFKAARAHAREHAARFRILTETEIRTPMLANILFLRSYLTREEHEGFEEKIIATLMAYDQGTPEIVLLAGFESEHNRLRAIVSLWRLLALGRIQADLAEPLTMKTPLWVSETEATTWSDPHSYVLRPLVRSAADRRRIASHMKSISRAF